MSQKQKPVYCQKCAYLLLIKQTKVLPLCVAKAVFTGTAIRAKTDVTGWTFAEKQNKDNNCPFFSRIGTLRSRQIKQWLREDLHAKKAKLKDYSINEEKNRVAQYQSENSSTADISDSKEYENTDEEKDDETINREEADGGVGYNDQGDTAESDASTSTGSDS